MHALQGLVIREPFITKILLREKTWEMRSKRSLARGQIALIRQGSGMVVGIAYMSDCLPAVLSREAYALAEQYHAIPPEQQEYAIRAGWVVPWILTDARPLSRPVRYKHRCGVVIWVNLEDDVSAQVISGSA